MVEFNLPRSWWWRTIVTARARLMTHVIWQRPIDFWFHSGTRRCDTWTSSIFVLQICITSDIWGRWVSAVTIMLLEFMFIINGSIRVIKHSLYCHHFDHCRLFSFGLPLTFLTFSTLHGGSNETKTLKLHCSHNNKMKAISLPETRPGNSKG